MAIQKVREYFRQLGMEDKIMEFEVSSASALQKHYLSWFMNDVY